MRLCNACNASNDTTQRFCDQCGTPLAPHADAQLPPQSRAPVRILVGRDPGCDLVVPEHHRQVSRKQCAVTVRMNRTSIEDLNSASGTFVNGRRIHGATMLQPSDEVRFGSLVWDTTELYRMVFSAVPVNPSRTGGNTGNGDHREEEPRMMWLVGGLLVGIILLFVWVWANVEPQTATNGSSSTGGPTLATVTSVQSAADSLRAAELDCDQLERAVEGLDSIQRDLAAVVPVAAPDLDERGELAVERLAAAMDRARLALRSCRQVGSGATSKRGSK